MSSKRKRDRAGESSEQCEDPPHSKKAKKQAGKESVFPSSSSNAQIHSDQEGSLFQSDRKKTLSRQKQFPWGNATCQELITQALLSTSKRYLTLKELFLWFERHHYYFARRSHMAKSEGWKKYVCSILTAKECFRQRRDEESGKLVWELAFTEP